MVDQHPQRPCILLRDYSDGKELQVNIEYDDSEDTGCIRKDL